MRISNFSGEAKNHHFANAVVFAVIFDILEKCWLPNVKFEAVTKLMRWKCRC